MRTSRYAASCVLVVAALFGGAAPEANAAGSSPGPDPARTYDVSSTQDREDLAGHLRQHVAHLIVEVEEPEGQPLSEPARTGYGIAWSKNRVAALCFVVESAKEIHVQGPDGTQSAHVVLYDAERRVALLETREPLSKIGLLPAPRLETENVQVDLPIFALVSTLTNAGVVDGVVIHSGQALELEGHPRIDLVLTHGMPVFDAQARFVGYARTVAWDRDRQMVVPTDKIIAAQAAKRAPPAPASAPKRPWWAQ